LKLIKLLYFDFVIVIFHAYLYIGSWRNTKRP